jgi:hypothetical protein
MRHNGAGQLCNAMFPLFRGGAPWLRTSGACLVRCAKKSARALMAMTCPGCTMPMLRLHRHKQGAMSPDVYPAHPRSALRPIPAEVGSPYRDDFREACAVLAISPNASAALKTFGADPKTAAIPHQSLQPRMWQAERSLLRKWPQGDRFDAIPDRFIVLRCKRNARYWLGPSPVII